LLNIWISEVSEISFPIASANYKFYWEYLIILVKLLQQIFYSMTI
jgi:hypothetical protein